MVEKRRFNLIIERIAGRIDDDKAEGIVTVSDTGGTFDIERTMISGAQDPFIHPIGGSQWLEEKPDRIDPTLICDIENNPGRVAIGYFIGEFLPGIQMERRE